MPSTQSRYREVYAGWQSDPAGFWEEAAREIDWIKPAEKVFDPQAGIYGRWFVGAECNTCYNAVDRHVATRGNQAAIGLYHGLGFEDVGVRKGYYRAGVDPEGSALVMRLQLR